MRWLTSDNGISLLKITGIFLLWYLIYKLWLLPDGQVDHWLTTNIVSVSAGILQMLDYEVYATGKIIGIGESGGIYLVNGSSGIIAVGLLIGVVIGFPKTWMSGISLITVGIGVIYVADIAQTIIFAITQPQGADMMAVTGNYMAYISVIFLTIVWIYFGKKNRASVVM